MHDLTLLFFFCACFAGSLLCTLFVRALARGKGWVAPTCSGHWHKKPIALHGGAGFMPLFLILSLALLFALKPANATVWQWALEHDGTRLALAMLCGAWLMFFCGLWDDIKPITPATKLIYQVGATSIFVYLGGVFHVTGQPALDLFITYVWFVGITNAVNMLDNMDGLSSGVGIIAAIMAMLLSWSCAHDGEPAAAIAAMLTASLMGYWFFNRHPASIFMGDSGSLALGFCLAALAMPNAMNGGLCIHAQDPLVQSLAVLLVPCSVLAVPIFDTTFVTFTRILSSQNIHVGGCDHTSHRLVRLGFSEPKAVGILYVLGLGGGIIALLAQRFTHQTLPLFGLFSFLLICTGAYLNHVSVERRQDGTPSLWINFLKGLLLKRNIAHVLLDTILIITCFWGAYLLRFDFDLKPFLRNAMIQALPLIVACGLLGLRLAGAYGATWRLASLADVPSYAMGVLIGTALSLSMSTMLSRFGEGYSRSAYITYGVLFFLAVTISRQSFSMLDNFIKTRAASRRKFEQQPVIIYGAGKGGMILLEETLFNPALHGFIVLGFVDDDIGLIGHKVRGFPVRDKSSWLQELNLPPEIWVSSKSISNGKALSFARQWTPTAPVRRQTFLLQEVIR